MESVMINKKIVILCISLFASLHLKSAQLIIGDPDAPQGATFSFGIDQNIFSSLGNFYVGSQQMLTVSKNFAFSRLIQGANAFEPLAPETVTLNGVPDQSNPLFGQKISALGILKPAGRGDTPVVVTATNPAIVYLCEEISNPQNVTIIPSKPVHDAAGNISAGIAALTTDVTGHVFAAVSPANGVFGDPNSGIALLVRGFLDEAGVFSELNAATGSLVPPFSALRLDASSPQVKIGDNLAALGTIVSLHWNDVIKRLYIGLQTTANGGANDGARAVVVGQFIENSGIALYPIAPASVFAPGNTSSIVGVLGANQTVTINLITTMFTSTAINYLIVVGGNGNASATQQSVFALPLTNAGNAIGTIANKNSNPIDLFQQSDVPKLLARVMSQPALLPADMTLATDTAAQIGGGNLPAGNIDTLTVRDDTVFVSVATGNSTGVYSSQALFDVTGKIKSWTAWQRAAGTTNNIFATALDAFGGTFILGSGNDSNSVNTINRTIWSNGDPQGLLPVTTLVNNEFSVSNGGIQGLTTFIPTPLQTQIPFLAIGGIGKLILVQTGQSVNNVLIPTPANEYSSVMEFTNGTINEDVDAKIIVISGGALDNVSSILTTAIGTDGNESWLFVGGTQGVAILTEPDGSGWDATDQLANNFAGLTDGMSFKTFGSYTFVKKIISDQTYLYIITNDLVDRIDLSTSDFAAGMVDAVTVATKNGLIGVSNRGGILDGIISASSGILATTGGMLRVGDNQNIQTALTEATLNWTPVIIPENAGAPTQFLGVSQNNQTQDIAQNTGGQFYALTANAGDNQARINRFVINPVGNGPMQSTTVQPFNDLFVENIPSFFINFGVFKSGFATDGALYFATRNQSNRQAPLTVLTPAHPEPTVGIRNIGERSTPVIISYDNGTEINAFERSQASGSWLIAGNFGMHVLE